MNLSKRREETRDDVIRNLGWAVTKVNYATFRVDAHHTERDVTKPDSRRNIAVTIKGSLESKPDSIIAQELHSRQSVLVHGLQELRKDSRRTNSLVDSRWEERHQTITTVEQSRHREVKPR